MVVEYADAAVFWPGGSAVRIGSMSASEKPGNKQTPEDDTKRKFREALAAKQGRKGEDHIDNGPQHVQAHGPVETKRTFRRKTG